MSFAIYKPGQGYWTRVMSAIAAALLVLMGAAWLWKLLANARPWDVEPVYVQAAAAVILIVVFTILIYWLVGVKPNTVDFMIATEGEMKKVNWSTRREVLGSTWVVIGLVVIVGAMIFVFDLFFTWVFQTLRVLEV
jgi:preprotein translocase subunit SecE